MFSCSSSGDSNKSSQQSTDKKTFMKNEPDGSNIPSISKKPTVSDGEKVIKNMFESSNITRDKGVELISFNKTNGEDKVIQGSTGYVMEFEIEIISIKTSGVFCYPNSEGFLLMERDPTMPPFHLAKFNGINIKKGERKVFKGELYFIKTEKGWRGQDGNLY
jgi:hypothetical protein